MMQINSCDLVLAVEIHCRFREINCEVIACSTDSHFSHLAWVNSPREKGGLGPMEIPLLADKSMDISKKYGVLKVRGTSRFVPTNSESSTYASF